jgi:26S proteasome regulatory subunit T4
MWVVLLHSSIARNTQELLNQMDGFDVLGKVKIIMATNRPDVLDPACAH